MLTRWIYPLKLRERISYHIQHVFPAVNEKNITLEFNKRIKLDLSKFDVGHRGIIFNGFYELRLTRLIKEKARDGGILIDVGANYGYFSCLWASLNQKNKVFAFEASPANLEPLFNNINKNSLNEQIEINPIAIRKEKGRLRFQ